MKEKKKKSILKNSKLLIFITVILLLSVCVAFMFLLKEDESIVENIPIISETESSSKNEKTEIEKDALYDYIELYDTNKQINPDYAGQIVFESGIINEPFVYSKDNNDYLRKNFKTGAYDTMGTIFMDYECKLDSQNIVLYGHYAYSYFDAGYDENGNKLINDELMFTPLKIFNNKDNYENNKKVFLVLENEIKEYEVCAVYYSDLIDINGILYPDEKQQYYLPEYTKDYFATYKESVLNDQIYDTGVEFKHNDDFLTLQTCVENAPNSREIVVCKYVGKTKLDRKGYKKYLESKSENKG